VKRVEIGEAVNAEDHGCAIDDELLLAAFQRGLDDPGVSLRPIVTTTRDQGAGQETAPSAKIGK
jgi:hypothetical protein